MSWKEGFSPVEVHTSLALHPSGPCATARRRVPDESLTAIRTPPSPVRAGCTIGTPDQSCFHRTLPSAGATLRAPLPPNSTTCATPPVVSKCGQLELPPAGSAFHRVLPVARS